MKLLFCLTLLVAVNLTYGQSPIPSVPENCINGIDDDGDGKTDLNDPECSCIGSLEDFSLLPNSSFELHNCCPVTVSQTECMENWFQAGYGTTDYLNTCGESMDIAISPTTGEVIDVLDSLNIFPFPDGDGIVRTVAFNGWTEYLGTCMTSSLTAGTTYHLKMYLASYNVFDPFVLSTAPIDINIYGAACGDLPFLGMEPDSSLDLLAQITYYPQTGWIDMECTFTPVTNYNAIVFGPEYSLDPYYTDHYQLIFYDHLRLSDNSVIEFPSLNVSGDPCSGTVEITASGSFSGNSPYWYDDGIHLDKNGITVINQSVSQPESTIITVIDPENNTCVSTDLAELAFTGCETSEELSFPNVITSNGDGINDVYTIANLESVSSLSFKVLNRWGDVVYKSENYLNDWRPNDLSSGVYFYLAEISLLNGETSLRQGTVQIVSK